ncbi:HDIG domain-containing protein [Methanoculleus chikugoensis]|uniref:HDIG domain-containing metalloprotein n=1 Tax=Methanoculleus chikugoensis TaxID=118126 RepID=UPI001FB33EB6|nr:HDIG domain-containing metalloprotein [Methanoculleus chikugoensis]
MDVAELREKRGGKYIQLGISDRTGRGTCKVWGDAGSQRGADRGVLPCDPAGGGLPHPGIRKGVQRHLRGERERRDREPRRPYPGGRPPRPILVRPCTRRRRWSPAGGTRAYDRPDRGSRRILPRLKSDERYARVLRGARGQTPAPRLYGGGLAEHTLETAEIAANLAGTVSRAEMDTDVLLAGALLHDIGKASCFCVGVSRSSRSPPTTPSSGTRRSGAAALMKYSAGVEPARFAHILHIVMSHHGPHGEVQPRTPRPGRFTSPTTQAPPSGASATTRAP